MALVIEKSKFYFGIPDRIPGIVGLDVVADSRAILMAYASFFVEVTEDGWLLHLVGTNEDGSVFVNPGLDPIKIPK